LNHGPGHRPAAPRLITDNDTLRASYHDLKDGDLFIGRLRLTPSEEHLLLDLVERGVRLFPAAVAQQLSRSKTCQADLLSPFMPPDTVAVHDLHGLMAAVSRFNAAGVSQVVTKHDRKNGGQGVLFWPAIEGVFSHCSCGTLALPLVVQPFFAGVTDIRVIILGDYQEAYVRHNPNNFRHNLHCGGTSQPCELTPAQQDLCRQVMARGKFPYAHLDLMVTEGGTTYLTEINLRGGIRGARITAEQYRERVTAIHDQARAQFTADKAHAKT
jgi:ribosomal protein S6--L-glutamate ligase